MVGKSILVNLLRIKMIHICGPSFYVGPVVELKVEPLLGPMEKTPIGVGVGLG
jgi:hypothetical protein